MMKEREQLRLWPWITIEDLTLRFTTTSTLQFLKREVSKTPLNLTKIISFIPKLLTTFKTPIFLTN